MVRIIFCGDRNWEDYQKILEIAHVLKTELDFIMIQGGAPGGDELSERAAIELEIQCERYDADWEKYGRAAGPIRNTQMRVKGRADGVVAFHMDIASSKGTKNMVDQSIKAGLPVWIYTDGPRVLRFFIKELKRGKR